MSFWTDCLGAQIRYYDAGGWRTRVIEAGKGEPVILMGGLSGHAESFIRNVMPLAHAGFRALSIDAIGHGFSAKPLDVDYHAPLFVEHLKRFMDSLDLKRAHLVGQSLGGWTACRFALQYPERVRSLTSITGAGFLMSDEASQAESEDVHQQVLERTRRASDEPTREKVRARLEWLMYDKSQVSEELVETRLRIFLLPDSRAVMGKVIEGVAGTENRRWLLDETSLPQIPVRTQIIWSDHNPTTPIQVAERAARLIPGARFHLVKHAGHWPMFEQAETVNRLLAEFLKSEQ